MSAPSTPAGTPLRRITRLTRPYLWPAVVGVPAGILTALLVPTPVDGVLIGLVVAAAVALVLALEEGESHDWLEPATLAHRGARRSVAALSWTLSGRDGRVAEGALRRLREDARRRLALRGIHLPVGLADADQIPHAMVEEARALLGARAWDVLTARGALLPTLRHVEQCVTALEALVPATTDDGALTVGRATPGRRRPHPTSRTHRTRTHRTRTHRTDGRTSA